MRRRVLRRIVPRGAAMSSLIRIPPLPVAHMRAMQLVGEANPSPQELRQIVDADPALTAALLRAANSAASAPIGPVRTAQVAIMRVGTTESRRIIMSVALSSSFGDLRRSQIDEHEIWRHLIATGFLADATAWGEVEHTEAFTAGLLHDIGRLAMAVDVRDALDGPAALQQLRGAAPPRQRCHEAAEGRTAHKGRRRVCRGTRVRGGRGRPRDLQPGHRRPPPGRGGRRRRQRGVGAGRSRRLPPAHRQRPRVREGGVRRVLPEGLHRPDRGDADAIAPHEADRACMERGTGFEPATPAWRASQRTRCATKATGDAKCVQLSALEEIVTERQFPNPV
ncbi:MAG: HDOD domain-containing protein [Dehalococcoidia bacterium]|nr:HDOD domain-containing protein [Dehalococcoidia bacterium]